MQMYISYTFWGNDILASWSEWYADVAELFKSIDLSITHIGIKSQSFNSGKIITVARKGKRIIEAISNGEIPVSMECYSLPKDYQVAVFDFFILCVRTKDFISVIFRNEYINIIDEKQILLFKKYINVVDGEVYSTSVSEAPLLYAYTKKSSNLETYKHIKSLI